MPETEDPAEEYFRILERMPTFQSPEGRAIIANAREDYKKRSQYTEEYWRLREEAIKSHAHTEKKSIWTRIKNIRK